MRGVPCPLQCIESLLIKKYSLGLILCITFFYKTSKSLFCTFQKVTLALSFSQISLYTGNGGDKRYHNSHEEEGALLVSKGITCIKVNVGGEGGGGWGEVGGEGRVVELRFKRIYNCTHPVGTCNIF